MKINIIQGAVRLKFFGVACLYLMFIWSTHAGGQGGTNYLVTNESTDNGGSRVSSVDYVSDGSFSAGGLVTSAHYAQRGGYVGGLHNLAVATNYTVTLFSNFTARVTVAALLKNVRSPDGDQITFQNVSGKSSQDGTATSDGFFVNYLPALNFVGDDSISWMALDSEGDGAMGIILAQVNGAPVLTLDSVAIIPGTTGATLTFSGLPQFVYTVQYTTDLAPPIKWVTLGSAQAINNTVRVVDPTAGTTEHRYYRTMYLPQVPLP